MDDLSVLESHLQEQLEDSTLKYERAVSGGIINRAAIFHSKMTMQSYFIKYNPGEVATSMFHSERNSLQLLAKTGCVIVPASVKVFPCSDREGAVHVLEFIPGLAPLTDFWQQFGHQIGRLHKYNQTLLEKIKLQEQTVHHKTDGSSVLPVDKFGCHFESFIGTFTAGQVWRDTWQEFFIRDILHPLVNGLQMKYGDRTVQEKWAWLQNHLHKVFTKVEILPAINHGDLCVANFGQTNKGPVLFDPSVMYGHSQFDLILSHMEAQFEDTFFEEYHKIIPRGPHWDNCLKVYEFFYHLVSWYHIGEESCKTLTLQAADSVKEMIERASTAV